VAAGGRPLTRVAQGRRRSGTFLACRAALGHRSWDTRGSDAGRRPSRSARAGCGRRALRCFCRCLISSSVDGSQHSCEQEQYALLQLSRLLAPLGSHVVELRDAALVVEQHLATPVQVPPVAHAREELPVAVSPYGLAAVGVGTLLDARRVPLAVGELRLRTGRQVALVPVGAPVWASRMELPQFPAACL
jgi:hypothetical protein